MSRTDILTRFPGVYAFGDVTSVGAASILAAHRGIKHEASFMGDGSCYIEFGNGQVGRVDVDFFSGPKPVGKHHEPSEGVVADKQHFGSSRKQRWFEVYRPFTVGYCHLS